ncbi:MAG: ATP-binding protein [Promethearchaeia archaeon]|nr:MAG: ATP-binding protein [Candidatus Lokiarchaeia archaeon]
MENIKNKILVMSGKGGVGKTTIAVNLAYSLSEKDFKIGLLDVDITGPNVPKMLNAERMELLTKDNKIIPVIVKENLKVVSMAFLVEKEKSIIWRGPMKHNMIKQFVESVEWGDLDYLIADLPPGTGDEALSIAQLIPNVTGSIIVSTPQEVALLDAEKSIDFLHALDIPIIGMVGNMTGDLFGSKSAENFAKSKNISYLGELELDKKIVESGDKGHPFVIEKGTKVSKSFDKLTKKLMNFCERRSIK